MSGAPHTPAREAEAPGPVTDVPALSSQDPEPGAWEEIADLVRELSQYVWSAGWLIDAEHHVWRWLEHPETAPRLARGYLPDLTRLAATGGHWVRWDARQRRAVPVRLDRWHRRHTAWLEAHPEQVTPVNF